MSTTATKLAAAARRKLRNSLLILAIAALTITALRLARHDLADTLMILAGALAGALDRRR